MACHQWLVSSRMIKTNSSDMAVDECTAQQIRARCQRPCRHTCWQDDLTCQPSPAIGNSGTSITSSSEIAHLWMAFEVSDGISGQDQQGFYWLPQMSHTHQALEATHDNVQGVVNGRAGGQIAFAGSRENIISQGNPSARALTPKRRQSRDTRKANRPVSLAATHPANYARSPSIAALRPLPSHLFARPTSQLATPPSSTTTSPPQAALNKSPVELPWRQYTDAMHQTSWDTHVWTQSWGRLRADTEIELGYVTSSVPMLGLPFGSMTEMACDWASEGSA